jgi:NADH dehydrogenase
MSMMSPGALPRRVAVLGGTGFLGRVLCERLVRAGDGGGSINVVVPTRRAAHGNRVRFLPTVEVRVLDVQDDKAVMRALGDCDALVNLIAILHGSAREFEQVHAVLPQRIARACHAVGLKRVVHVSALGVGGGNEPSNYLRSKAAGEAAWKASALDVTLLRPSVMFGAEDRFLNLFAKLQAVFPLMPLAAADAQFQPVWVDDVAEAILRCLQRPETIGLTLECAGPEVMTLADIVRAAGRWSGHPRPLLPLPMALGKLQALAMELLPGEPLMSRDNLDSTQLPNIASGKLPGLESLGITPTALATVAPGYLGHTDGRTRLDALRAVAGR